MPYRERSVVYQKLQLKSACLIEEGFGVTQIARVDGQAELRTIWAINPCLDLTAPRRTNKSSLSYAPPARTDLRARRSDPVQHG
jgi:hypothetical protein